MDAPPADGSAAQLRAYHARVHARTRRLVLLIPPGDIEWRPTPGWFTFGGIVRHLAAIERLMYAENAVGWPSRYAGHGRALADGYDAVLAYYDRLHAEAAALLATLDDAALARRILTPDGASVRVWKWLRAMHEHEAHHRGQLYLMLAMRGVATPPIFGLTAEQVAERAPLGAVPPPSAHHLP